VFYRVRHSYVRLLPLMILAVGLGVGTGAGEAWARKTNQPVYEDPFDIGAGGASLTRASKEGRVFANPALLPQGGSFHRWAGFTLSLLSNKESVETARSLATGAKKQEGGDEEAGPDTREISDAVFKQPLRVGWGASLAWVTRFFGLSVFSRFEPDLRARELGSTGVPEIEFHAESYHGVALGTAIETPFRWLTFGVTGKYLYAAEPNLTIEVTDEDAIADVTDPRNTQDLASHNKGVGFDAGMLMFFQGKWIDYSLAAKVDDVGNTKFIGDNPAPTEFKQVVSAGTAVTFHTGADALHLALDYRDIMNAYGEEMFKKYYAGVKLTLRTYIGLAAGYYHGSPSIGAEVDFILFRLAATAFTRELGDHPGVEPRNMYMLSLSLGY